MTLPRRAPVRASVSLVPIVALLTTAGALGGCARSRADVGVSRFIVAIAVQDDGALDVAEQIVVRPTSTSAPPAFTRVVSSPEVDALRFVAGTIDGRELTPGAAPDADLVVASGRTLEVRWRLPPRAGNGDHTLGLRYRAAGVLAVQGGHGRLRWPALPSARGYAIESSRIALTIGPDAVLYGGSGIAEAGWTVTRPKDGLLAERAPVPDGEGAWLLADISVPEGRLRQPAWQLRADLHSELLPAWISGGLFIIVVGAGVLVSIRLEYGPRLDVDGERRAVAGALRRSGLVCFVVAAGTSAIIVPALDRLGPSSLSLPASIVMVGVALLWRGRVGKRLPEVNPEKTPDR